ncbi:unnamed protein product [Adineta steineri]|uniref:Uncharacterized protein n=1 Tax=Adineta steineri TaxID=433720 RepID=A0A815B7Y0_9BILA|nr:unnamed protein product [Adineta steineri]CAF1266833.1 unnamed protein product [Adineta steineri]CAF1278506.1 unnamed protein product [Adineta steineri]
MLFFIIILLSITGSILILYKLFIYKFLSLTVQVKPQICYKENAYDTCSTNSGCGCFHMDVTPGVGVCGFLWVACAKLEPCDLSSAKKCSNENNTICVHHPRCHPHPVCYPTTMLDERICPPEDRT